jgi:hypothetical protein
MCVLRKLIALVLLWSLLSGTAFQPWGLLLFVIGGLTPFLIYKTIQNREKRIIISKANHQWNYIENLWRLREYVGWSLLLKKSPLKVVIMVKEVTEARIAYIRFNSILERLPNDDHY